MSEWTWCNFGHELDGGCVFHSTWRATFDCDLIKLYIWCELDAIKKKAGYNISLHRFCERMTWIQLIAAIIIHMSINVNKIKLLDILTRCRRRCIFYWTKLQYFVNVTMWLTYRLNKSRKKYKINKLIDVFK